MSQIKNEFIILPKEEWEELGIEIKKALIIDKAQEIHEKYPNSYLYAEYEDIYIILEEEQVKGKALEKHIKWFEEVMFKAYSEKELYEVTKPYSQAKL